MDVTAWLTDLALDRYAEAFAENDIDGETLVVLTEDDLRELGVASLGHRKKIMAAIATLGEPPAGPVKVPDSVQARPGGERRQVTVLFADISGFTRMTTEQDAEEIHRLLNTYFEAVDGAIRQFGGSVDKHIGDAVMAVFGAPIAHSDDPERAIRAALDMHRAAAELDPPISIHIGIASGQVVASGTGSAAHSEYTMTGESVNLASRLQDEADAGETLISDAVRRAVSAGLICEEIADLSVKGIDRPVTAWRVHEFSADGPVSDTPFVGRQAEIRQFTGALAATRDTGLGQAIYVRGEAGLGKTRLVEEFRALAEQDGFAWHAGQALDFGAGGGQDAIRMVLRGLLDLSPNADRDARADSVTAAVAGELIDPALEIHLNDLLDIPQPAALRSDFDAMDRDTRARGNQQAIRDILMRVARRGPVAILIEDIHWADETVLGHLAVIADAVRDCPALLIMTSRIEGDPIDAAWRALAQGSPLMTIDLGALREAEAMALADAYLDGDNHIARICVERAEGNPLFLDQLLRNAGEDAAAALPGSVSSIMLARMDRLAPMDRDALQAAAVIGQRFTGDALRHVMGIQGYDDQPLRDHVLLRRAGEDLIFAHALIRECVYASLLGDRRRDLHRRAADWYAGKNGDGGEPGLRAEHLDRAEDPQAAAAYLAAARIQADAYHEDHAIELTTRGIELATGRTDRYELYCLHAELLQQLARPAESVDAYRDALSSAETDREKCKGLIGVAAGIRLTGGDVDGMAALDEAEALTQSEGEDDFERELAQINLQKGNFRFAMGEIDLCMAHHQKSLAHAERAGDAELQARALGGLGDAHYAHCRMGESLEYFRRCLAICEEHNFGRILVAHRFVTGVTRRYLNETDEALTDVRDAVELCHRVGNPRAAMYALTIQGELLTEGLELTEAEPSLREALSIADSFGNRRFRSYILMEMARLSLMSNQLEEARSHINEAHALSVEIDPRFLGPRIAGLMAVVARDPVARAAALAEGQSILDKGCLAHNHLWFYRDAMDASLAGENWDDALRFATMMEGFTANEPLPWADFYIARGRALAAHGQDADNNDELEQLRDQARDIGYLIAIPALDQALETP